MEKKGDKRDCKKHKFTSHSADQADKKLLKEDRHVYFIDLSREDMWKT